MTEGNAATDRTDFIDTLKMQRSFLRYTVKGISDPQARERTTVSQLCLGGIVKHVTAMENQWTRFIVEGAASIGSPDEAAMKAHAATFDFSEHETLAELLAAYDEAAHRTEDTILTVSSLDDRQALPEAPWFPPGATWSVRQVLLHIVAETAQHSGHADLIREALDGQKTMG